MDDIKNHLRKQWAGLFQRLLYEQRFKKSEERRIDFLANQIADIKTAVFTSISSSELKDTARGAIQFRRLIDFLYAIYRGTADFRNLMKQDIDWKSLLDQFDVVDVRSTSDDDFMSRMVLILRDNTHFRLRLPFRSFDEFGMKWDEFRHQRESAKEAIISAVLDYSGDMRPRFARHVNEPYHEQASLTFDEAGQASEKST